MKIAVFDIGGTAVKYGLFEENQLSQVSQFETPESMKAVIDSFEGIVAGVAISAPGAVNIAERRIDGISAVEYLHHRPIFVELEECFDLPVAIENDANCAGICEVQLGAGQGFRQAVFVVLGTVVGGAIFINGSLYKGAHLFGGEFGLMKGTKNKTLSLNGTAVKAAISYSEQTGETIDGRELFKRSDTRDRLAQQLLDEMYDNLAEMLYNVQVSLDPEIVILGGGISARKELAQEIAKRLEVMLRNEGIGEVFPKIVCCHYQNNANLLGAALNYINQKK